MNNSTTVGELRNILETYPDSATVSVDGHCRFAIQQDTDMFVNLVPNLMPEEEDWDDAE